MRKRYSLLVTLMIMICGVVLFVVPIIARSSALDIKSQRQADFNQAAVSKDKHREITPEDVKKGFVEGEVLVKFKENKIDLSSHLSDKKIHAFYQDKAVKDKMIIQEGNLALLKSDSKTTEKLISELRKDTAVEYVEPNYIYHAESIPNDPEFSKQWGLNNTGQEVNGTAGTNDADIDMPEAWDFLADKNTSEVKVAVLDSGVDLNHPDLSANIIEGYDYVDNDTTPQDLYGHGTHVAGVIAALGNNSLGITGFSPNIKIIPIRIFDANGYGTADTIAAGIWEACNMGAKIINLSMGGHGFSQSMYNAISDCASQGSLFIVAAGNASDNNDINPFYPASYDLDNIISVAATDQNDNLWEFSNYGVTSVDVAAPGVNIYSTYPNLIPIFYDSPQVPLVDNIQVLGIENNGSYEFKGGTSMAAPYVTGLAALIKSYKPNYSYKAIKDNIINNVDKKDTLTGKVLSGGRINAYNSLLHTDTTPPTATINYLTTNPTNQDVIATLAPSETVTVTNNNGAITHTFTENGSFTFEFADAAGNTGSAAATVNNIDKIAPKDPTSYSIYSDNTKTRNLALGIIHFYPYPYFEWSGASDEGSGVKGYYIKFTNTAVADAMSGSFQTDSFFTASKITSGGTYYLHIKTIDKLGNVSPGMYLRYNFTPPKVLGSEIGEPFIVTGTKKGGGPEVRVFSTSGKLLKSFNAYPDTFRGGINVAVGDIDGNDTREIITSTREGGIPTIRVFDVEGKNLGWDFDAYDSKFRGGINIAVGDIEGDGPAEIAVAPMSGGSPNVRIFGMRNGKIVPVSENFMAYDKNFRGGIAISIGDIDGDGIGDIITTPTSRGGPHIRVFGVRNKRYVPVTLGIMAYAPTFRGGINSTVGDVSGDGRDEIMTGIVSAGGPHVRIFGIKKNGTFGLLDPGFMAYNPAFRGGVSVTSIDINGDGYDEIITGVGGNGNPTVRIFNQSGKQVSKEFNAYSTNYKNGITLAAGYF